MSSTDEAAGSKCILVLATYAFPFHEWISSKNRRVLFTDTTNKKHMDAPVIKKFEHVEFFDSFSTSGLVELRALELQSKFRFTHVVFQAEQDVIRAARIRQSLGLTSGQSL